MTMVSSMPQLSSDECLTQTALQRLLADELDDEQATHVREHLNHCEACRQKMEDLLAALDNEISALVSQKHDEVEPWMKGILEVVSERRTSLMPQETTADSPADKIIFPERSADDQHCGRLDEFEILKHIASGATGHLFRALDTKLNRTVAIKVLRAELCVSVPARQRFLQEANAIARMDSDFIVDVYDVRERADFPPYLVMEFIDGPSLQQKLECGERPGHLQAVELVCQILTGLSAAHEKSVIHRDVKPGNILLLEKQQRAKLVDFGLARLEEQSFDLTSPGSIAGTPSFMAPEQILDAHAADEKSDVYSAGAVLYELLTGEIPFRGSVRMVLHQVLHEEPRPPRSLDDQIPRDLQTICLKAMSKAPSHRYTSAVAFRDDLQRWMSGMPVLARPVGMVGRFLRWRVRNPSIANLSLIIVGLLLTLVVMWGRFTLDVTEARNQLVIRNRDLLNSYSLLKEANDRSRAERAAAIGEADRASRQANLAFRVLNRLTFGLQNALADRPAEQQQLLMATINDLQQLSNEVTTDSPVSLTLTVAFLRLGEASRKTKQLDAAVQCYEHAEQTLNSLSADFQAEPDTQQCYVWLHLGRGEVAIAANNTTLACHEFCQAAGLCRQIEVHSPERIATMHAHAVVNIRLVTSACPESLANASPSELLHEAIWLLEHCVSLDASAEDVRFDLAAARLQRARYIQSTQLAAATDDAFAAIDLLFSITEDSRLRIEATQNALEAIAFIATHQVDSASAVDARLERCRERGDTIIGELLTTRQIAAGTAADWRYQLNTVIH